MSQDATLRTLIEELMADYDSTIDTAEGSTFDTAVMSPLLTRIGGSPLEVDLEAFLIERLQTEFPDIDVSVKSGVVDLLIKPAVAVLEPLRREINGIKIAQSLNNVDSMTTDELNALLGNYFTAIQEGGTASGVVRMFFSAPQTVRVTPLTRFSTGSSLNFYPIATQAITQEFMAFNLDSSGLYFFDVTVQAENSGSEYNVTAGEVNSVQGISGVVRVSNPLGFDNATTTETKAEAVARAQESITVRNLSVERGVNFTLTENFPTLSVIQVVGKGDDEMLRDIITGPTAVSSIPGGIVGDQPTFIGFADSVRIGGKTDVYVYQRELVTDTLDIQNLTNRGTRIYAGNGGFTAAGGTTTTFEDLLGNFTSRGILNGDVLRVGEDSAAISGISSTSLTLDTALPGGLFAQDYEIVRVRSDLIEAPLYDLVAETSAGAAVFDADGDPVQPIPGDLDLAELVDSGSTQVKKTENIANNNLELPAVRVSSVEFLDPLTLESSGVTIPLKDPLYAENLAAFSGGAVGFKATGSLRVYFRDAVSGYVTQSGTTFTVNQQVFVPGNEIAGLARVDSPTSTTLTLEGADYTGDLNPGYRILYNGEVYTVVSFVYDTVDTQVTVRETIADNSPSALFIIYVGTQEADMAFDSTLRLYYFDVPVQAALSGSAGNLAAGNVFAVAGMIAEGYALRSTESVLSFSVKDLCYLELSNYVNDTTDLTDIGTAYAIRINYEYASTVPAMQTFVEDAANRIVGEDVLVRHFLPRYVRMSLTLTGLDSTTAINAISEYLRDLDPRLDLEASDLVDILYSSGATKVNLPFTMVAISQSVDRLWTGEANSDAITTSRVQHFLPDADNIIVS